jgi:hypothetical protein
MNEKTFFSKEAENIILALNKKLPNLKKSMSTKLDKYRAAEENILPEILKQL